MNYDDICCTGILKDKILSPSGHLKTWTLIGGDASLMFPPADLPMLIHKDHGSDRTTVSFITSVVCGFFNTQCYLSVSIQNYTDNP